MCYMLSFRLRPSWRTRLGLLFAVSDHTWTSRSQARRHSGSDPRDGAWGVAGGQARRGSQAGGLVGRRGGGAGERGARGRELVVVQAASWSTHCIGDTGCARSGEAIVRSLGERDGPELGQTVAGAFRAPAG